MTCGWSQHHQEGLVLVSGLEEGQGPVVDEISVVIILIIVPVLLLSAINRQGVVVIILIIIMILIICQIKMSIM